MLFIKNKLNFRKGIFNAICLISGTLLMACSTAMFLLPNQLSTGGFSGIGTIAYYFFNIPVGTAMLVLNLPLFFIAFFRIGKRFLFKSIVGTILLSVFIDVLENFNPVTNDRFLACIYGGILTGIGTSLILKANASTGGSDLLSYVVRSYNDKFKSGDLIIFVDSIIIFLNILFFKEIEIGLYSAIAIYLMGKMIDVVFEGVNFGYNDDKIVLHDINMYAKPGQKVAFVGATGAGKTTITNLINKFYTIQKGEILIDGVNINDINLADLRKNIGTILQDPFIFAKSIKENIKLFNNIDDEKIDESIKLASAESFINKLENGIDEIAKERGNSFSAGEKQLLAFARIFALNPSIFILDEATANIDTTTEQLIQNAVDKLSSDKTSIFIAHRLATIVNVDKIIVLNKGEIIEQGNHNELVKSGGYYSSLYNAYYNSLV